MYVCMYVGMNVLDWDKPSWMTARCPKHLILKFLVFCWGQSPHGTKTRLFDRSGGDTSVQSASSPARSGRTHPAQKRDSSHPRFVGRVSYHPGGVQVEREGSGSRHSGKPDF